jgi:hypothetical protein
MSKIEFVEHNMMIRRIQKFNKWRIRAAIVTEPNVFLPRFFQPTQEPLKT